MNHSDLILLAKAVADEAENAGFSHTARAMRKTIEDLLPSEFEQFDKSYSQDCNTTTKNRKN